MIAELAKSAGEKPKQFRKLLDQWVKDNRDNADLSDILIRPQIQADIGGQLMVDVHEAGKISLAYDASDGLIVLQEAPPAFLNLRWDEAIEAYSQLDIPRQREFTAIVKQYDGRSKKARQLLLEALRKRSLVLINKALDEGTTLREYASNLEQFASDLGISADNPAYLENVFRTNLQTAYSAGRWRAMQDPDVVKERPYWQYHAVNDADTCDFCRMMDGKIFEVGNPDTDFLVPPCHYQSRSAAVSHVREKGDRVEKKPPPGYHTQQGYISDFAKSPLDLIKI